MTFYIFRRPAFGILNEIGRRKPQIGLHAGEVADDP